MRVVIAGGGTGGHLFPGFAVARTLRQQHPDAEIHWLGGQRGIERELLPLEGYPLTLLAAPSLRMSGAGFAATLRDAIALVISIPQAVRYLLRVRPGVLFSTRWLHCDPCADRRHVNAHPKPDLGGECAGGAK